MNKKLFVFLAAITLVLVGCNKEKEENMESTAVSTEQQQQAQPAASSNVVPETKAPVVAPAPAVPMPEQGNTNVIGQQTATPQTPQEAAAAIPVQPPAPPIQPSQLVQAAPTVPVAPEQPPMAAANAPAVTPSAVQVNAVPGSGMVVTDQAAPVQNPVQNPVPNVSGMQQNVVANPQVAAPPVTGTSSDQATNVVSTKVLYQKSITANDTPPNNNKNKPDTGNGGNGGNASTTPTPLTPPSTLLTPVDDEDE